jgi:hypothetical protein
VTSAMESHLLLQDKLEIPRDIFLKDHESSYRDMKIATAEHTASCSSSNNISLSSAINAIFLRLAEQFAQLARTQQSA